MRDWSLLALIVGCTVIGDLMQSIEMRRASGARKLYLALAVFFMAVSFFAFMTLVEKADLSFAVPASAASLAIETVLARVILKERVDSRRWLGAALVGAGVWLLAV